MRGIPFSIKKSLQVLYYLQSRSGISDKLSLLKLIFFADRYHIRNYGIPMLQDDYCAMTLGPVCSKTYGLIKKGLYYDGLTNEGKAFVDGNLFCNGDIVSVKDTGSEQLSASDLEALDFSIANFARFTPYQLSEITHAYPEWSKYQELLESHRSASEQMDYADFFNNPDTDNVSIKRYLNGKDPFADDDDVLNAMREEYRRGA